MEKKLLSFISEIKGIDSDERSLTALVSTNTRDRMDEVLDPDGVDLKNFKKNPVVLFAHDTHIPVIGKALWIKKSIDGIMAKVQFAKTQLAEDVFNLFKGGFMSAFSVGFMPKEWVDGDGVKKPSRTFTKWELLEFSAVAVPANPDALVLALKSKELKLHEATIKALNIEEKPKKKEPAKEPAKKQSELLQEIETLQKENKELINRSTNLEQDKKDLRYKLYLLLNKPEKTLSEMTDDAITKIIEDSVVGVIRKVTGKVS